MEQETAPKSIATKLKDILLLIFRIFKKIWLFFSIAIGSVVIVLAVLLIPVILMVGSAIDESGADLVDEKLIEGEAKEKIVVLNLSGIITDETSDDLFAASEGYITPRQIKNLLAKAKSDPMVKVLILRINSPGGTVVASDEIFNYLKEFNQKTKIPIVSYLADVAASGGYYIAVAGNKVIAHPASITGSIGVIAQVINLEGLYDKVGIKAQVIKSGQFKDIGSDAREMTSEERKIFQTIIDESYDKFLEVISDSRKMTKEVLKPLADGRIYTGKQAYEVKLIDGQGGFSKAIEEARTLAKLDKFSLVEYQISGGFFGSLAGFASQKIDSANPLKNLTDKRTAGVLYLWIPE